MADETENDEVAPAAPGSWRALVGAGLVLLGLGLAIFWPFVFGDGVLLYRDIGRDSLSSYYTDFVHLSNYLRSDGFPSWSFHIGMGQDLAYATGFLFWEPVSWLPARFIARALVYQHLVKVLVAGLLFFRFWQLRGAPLPVAILGSLVIAFSAYMTLGSCWYLPAEELLAFTAILLGVETVLQRGRWLLLVVSIALIGLINPFYLYLCALFLGCYVPLRLIARNGWQPKPILKRSLVVAALAFLAVALGTAVTLPYLHVVLNSPRGSGATNSLGLLGSFPKFGLESAAHYVTAFLRPFANDLLGAGDAFRGWQNYLEAPQTYCGLICLLLLPQAFLGGKRRHRVIIVLFLLWTIIPTVFPWFRYLFWLFKGDYYRTYSLFSVLGIIILSLFAFRHYLAGKAFSIWLLFGWGFMLIGALCLPFAPLQSVIDPGLRLAVIAYLLSYLALLLVGWITNRRTFAAYLLLAVTVLELLHFNRITVSERDFVKKHELVNGFAAPPNAFRAIQDLQREDNSFFRTTSLRMGKGGAEIDPNEPMLLGYYGTSSYSSFNDMNYIRFLADVEAMPSYREIDSRWTVGLAGHFVLSMFAGEKYALVEDPAPFQKALQYELVRRYDNSYLFRNALSLPFGLIFTRYLSESEFRQLPGDRKEQALLTVAVLADRSVSAAEGLKQISASELERELAAFSFPTIVEQRRASAFRLTSFAQNRLEGVVHLDDNGLLILQTPFNPGWRAFQNGEPTPVTRADIGLLGLPVKAGEHKMELRYRNPWLLPGTIITGLSLLLLTIGLWRKPRLAISLA